MSITVEYIYDKWIGVPKIKWHWALDENKQLRGVTVVEGIKFYSYIDLLPY